MRHFHDRTGQIRSDRNGGQVERTQAIANLLEDRIIACVSSEKDSLRVSGHSPRAPKPLVPIPESTAREMLSRETGHGETFDPSALPPIQLFHLRDADLHKPRFESQGDKKYRMVQLGQSSDCFQIKMIIVIMRDKDQINGGQILKWYPWRDQTLRTRKGDRARPIRPVRISQDVDAIELNEKCGMPDPSDCCRRSIVHERGTIVLHAGEVDGSWMNRGCP